MQLLDFSKALEIAPEYTGSEKKKTMILDGKKYLVKFPDPNRSTKLEISYISTIRYIQYWFKRIKRKVLEYVYNWLFNRKWRL